MKIRIEEERELTPEEELIYRKGINVGAEGMLILVFMMIAVIAVLISC